MHPERIPMDQDAAESPGVSNEPMVDFSVMRWERASESGGPSDPHGNEPPVVDGRSRRAQRIRQARRGQVLEAALDFLSRKVYHRTSITDIIRAAGIARGTFYLYFGNKQAIFDELLGIFIDKIVSSVHRVNVDLNAPPPVEQIRANVTRVVDVLVQNENFTRLLLRQAVGQNPEFDERIAVFYRKTLDLIEGALVLGQSMGIVRFCDPQVVASCILGSLKEVANQFLLDPNKWRSKKDVLVGEILDYNLKGVFHWPHSNGQPS